MAISQYYVDPSINANSGAGTVGDPYGDLQHALDTITRDATDGDQINIKAGTDEVLSSALTLATYGTPTAIAPLILRGYTSSANDGGVGGINCGGNGMIAAQPDFVVFIDLEVRNGGANNLIHLDNDCLVVNCTVHNGTGSGIVLNDYGNVIGCAVYDVSGVGINVGYSSFAIFNYVYNGATYSVSSAISAGYRTSVFFNIININGSSNGILTSDDNSGLIYNNTVFSTSGTGSGIKIDTNDDMPSIINNYIEGFSGAGGIGINVVAATKVRLVQNNYYYNNTSNETFSGEVAIESGNTSLSASGLVDPANDDFRAKGSLRAGAWPPTFPELALTNYLDIGAVQRREPLRYFSPVRY